MRKKLLVLIIVLAIIFAVVLAAKISQKKTGSSTQPINNQVNKNESAAPVNGNIAKNTGSSVGSQTANSNGERLDVMPSSPSAPKHVKIQTKDIPAQSVKLQVSKTGFTPKEIRIKSGSTVTLAITSTGGTHVLLFTNSSLMALTTMVLDKETKLVTFTAPAPGEYAFRDDLPTMRANTGVMIVE